MRRLSKITRIPASHDGNFRPSSDAQQPLGLDGLFNVRCFARLRQKSTQLTCCCMCRENPFSQVLTELPQCYWLGLQTNDAAEMQFSISCEQQDGIPALRKANSFAMLDSVVEAKDSDIAPLVLQLEHLEEKPCDFSGQYELSRNISSSSITPSTTPQRIPSKGRIMHGEVSIADTLPEVGLNRSEQARSAADVRYDKPKTKDASGSQAPLHTRRERTALRLQIAVGRKDRHITRHTKRIAL